MQSEKVQNLQDGVENPLTSHSSKEQCLLFERVEVEEVWFSQVVLQEESKSQAFSNMKSSGNTEPMNPSWKKDWTRAQANERQAKTKNSSQGMVKAPVVSDVNTYIDDWNETMEDCAMMTINITNPRVADTKMLLSEALPDLAVRSWLQLLLLSDSEPEVMLS